MKKGVLFLVALSAWLITVAQVTWDGVGDGTTWSDPANWFPDGVPAATSDVVLDHSIVSGNYTVVLPAGAVTIFIHSLTISPASSIAITLLLPSSNTANPGLQVTGAGDALVLNSGAVLRNSSGASVGAGISVINTFRINNGGRYIHHTARANAAIISQLSTVAGTESGIFEYDVPVASYTPSLSGRTYGTLVLSATANAGTVTYVGAGGMPLTIRGDLQINTGVTLSINMTAAFIVRGNYQQSVSSVFNLQNSTNTNTVRIAGDLSNQGMMTETGTGLPVLELNGTTVQHISVTGTILNTIDVHLNNSAGAVLLSNLLLPYRYTIVTGNLSLENFDLTTPFINQVSAPAQTTNHIVTNGTGRLIIPAVSSAVFPVGASDNHYNPVEVVNGVNAQFAIRVIDSVSPGLAIPFPAVVNRTWFIDALPDPGAAAMLRLGFYNSDWLNGFNTGIAVDLGKYISGWNAVRTGLAVSATGADPSYEVGFTNMVSGYNGPFIIGNTAFGLPVNFFITTRARQADNAANISWSVSNAGEVDHFEIQRSVAGADYTMLATLSGVANRLHYSYTDNALSRGRNLYRVKAYRRASSSVYSNIVAVVNSKDILISRIVPNPARDKATIYVSADSAAMIEWILADINGRVVRKWRETIAEGNGSIVVSVENLPAGVYLLTGFAGDRKLHSVRVIKM